VLEDLVARFDERAEAELKKLRGNPVADRAFYIASFLGDFGSVWCVIALIQAVFGGRAARRNAMRVIAANAIDWVLVNAVLKTFIQRERPADQPDHPHRIRQPLSSSFPSGHATAAFCGATLLSEGKRIAPLYYAGAAVVATSRAFTRMHHASDVVGGAVIGLVFGRVARRVMPIRRPNR
jgi:undecaprenyl-diphosphatase